MKIIFAFRNFAKVPNIQKVKCNSHGCKTLFPAPKEKHTQAIFGGKFVGESALPWKK